MVKKTVGYVELEWTCPNCGGKNRGFDQTCQSCGAAQPEDVQFQQAAEEKLLADEAQIERAKAGPDVHCRFCGTRNEASATHCSRCGAELAEGAAREAGRALGALRDAPAKPLSCPACGTPNDPNASHCASCGASLAPTPAEARPAAKPAAKRGLSRGCLIGLGALVLLACSVGIVFLVRSGKTEATTGRVEAVEWTRSIAVEALLPAEHEDWYDEIPAGAPVGDCQSKLHHTSSEPVPGAEEVCGTPYTVDTGSGAGEVVQDCDYNVYADWCTYTVDEWQQVDTITLTGDDLLPVWPQVALGEGEQEGAWSEEYQVVFTSEGDRYTYSPEVESEFLHYEPGSTWTLEVNAFGQVREVLPVD
jgi:DNA-directed RNA polymerase subunit RPC12/RpoP